MAYTVPDLPYPYDALEPHISAETMRFHHDKHHAAYVEKANAALADTRWAAEMAPEELLTKLDEVPAAIRAAVTNNVGGHVNHSLFWASMSPEGEREPRGKLLNAIKETFRTVAIFKETMEAAAMSTFGSGWAWLVHDGTRVLIVTTTNQDSPLS
ncbi:MAG: superoxide dismutase, Fe-Mn family, partial [bacterium]